MHSDVLIVGGGMTGLSTALHLRTDGILYEKESKVGGCLRSFETNGYTIDQTGHLLHFRNEKVRALLFERLTMEWLHFHRNAKVFIEGQEVPYPIQYNLHALPLESRVKCLEGYLDAAPRRSVDEASFAEWSRSSFGRELHDLFFQPYNEKLWQADLDTITAEWTERFVAPPNRHLVIRGAMGPHERTDFGYNARFSYPKYGGSQTIADELARILPIPHKTGVELIAVDPAARICEFSDGSRVHYGSLVTTLPLPRLVERMHGVDPEIRELSRQLRHNSVFYFAFGFKAKEKRPTVHWVYVPEREFLMYRVGVLSNYSPAVAPDGSVLLCAELGFPGDSARRVDPEQLRNKVLEDLKAIGLVQPDWSLELDFHSYIDCAYVIFDRARREILSKISAYLQRFDIRSVGRYGAWGYGSVEDALLEGEACAEQLNGQFRCK